MSVYSRCWPERSSGLLLAKARAFSRSARAAPSLVSGDLLAGVPSGRTPGVSGVFRTGVCCAEGADGDSPRRKKRTITTIAPRSTAPPIPASSRVRFGRSIGDRAGGGVASGAMTLRRTTDVLPLLRGAWAGIFFEEAVGFVPGGAHSPHR